jgi:hypothetical protein
MFPSLECLRVRAPLSWPTLFTTSFLDRHVIVQTMSFFTMIFLCANHLLWCQRHIAQTCLRFYTRPASQCEVLLIMVLLCLSSGLFNESEHVYRFLLL